MDVSMNKVVTLLGGNGAGKTTTLKVISGVIAPKSGQIFFKDRRIDGLSTDRIVKQGIVHIPQDRELFSGMNVLENLELGSIVQKDQKLVKRDIEKVFNYFPILRERLQQKATTLSGGEQQMLAIGRALMSQPKILLLDEITLGLSPLIVENIFEVIKQINESSGIGILLVEQNVVLALELAETGYIIENGRIVGQDNAKVLLEDERVRDAYLGLPSGSGETG